MQCRSCGLIYCDPQPPVEESVTVFSEDYFHQHYLSIESARIDYIRSHLASLPQIGHPPGKWLDIGSGAGLLLEVVEEMGWDGYGVEPSAEGCKLARQRTSAQIFNGFLQNADLEDNSFDVVSIWDVLPWSSDPMAICAKAVRLLGDKGVLVMKVSYLRERIYRFVDLTCHIRNRGESLLLLPSQMFSFPPRAMEVMCRKLGMKIVFRRAIDEIPRRRARPRDLSECLWLLGKQGLEFLNGKPTYIICAEKAGQCDAT